MVDPPSGKKIYRVKDSFSPFKDYSTLDRSNQLALKSPAKVAGVRKALDFTDSPSKSVIITTSAPKDPDFFGNKREVQKDQISAAYEGGTILDRMNGDPVRKVYAKKMREGSNSCARLPVTDDSKRIMQD
jgi:hypothetical protein